MDYTTLSLEQVRSGLEDIARDAQTTFGGLDARQLNWRSDPSRWSVAQCFEHLITANRLMIHAAEEALDDSRPRTVWQRLPVLPGFVGRLMIRSLSPDAARKMTAPSEAQPTASDIAADIIQRFVQQNRDAAASVHALDQERLARTIMASPFLKVITYSVMDAWRLMVAHERRHFEQARRVMQTPEFPKS